MNCSSGISANFESKMLTYMAQCVSYEMPVHD